MIKICKLRQPAMCSRATRIQDSPIANSEKCEHCEWSKVVTFAEMDENGDLKAAL